MAQSDSFCLIPVFPETSELVITTGSGCDSLDFYTPNPLYLKNYPIVTVRLHFHVFQNDTSGGNFGQNAEDSALLLALFNGLNLKYDSLITPYPNGLHISDSRIRFKLEAIHFYADSVGYHAYEGSNFSAIDPALNLIHQNTGLTSGQRDSSIHVLLFNNTRGHGGFGNFQNDLLVAVSNKYYDEFQGQKYSDSTWAIELNAGHLAHEIGHVLGLWHSFGGSCVSSTEHATNRIMDYHIDPDQKFSIAKDSTLPYQAFLGCEIATIHRNLKGITRNELLSNNQQNIFISKLVVLDFCHLDTTKSIHLGVNEIDTWQNIRYVQGHIEIDSGAKLILKCYTSVPKDGKIIVHKGGELVVDGGIISNECGLMWHGIVVEGDKTKSQLSLANQGSVRLLNGAVIEHAKEGIQLAGFGSGGTIDLSTTGGFVRADSAIFRNNKRDVAFLEYSNIFSTAPYAKPSKNQSYFKACKFEIDDNYRGSHTKPGPFVTLWGVQWVDFNGCTFSDARTSTTVTDRENRKDGILTIDASYRINCAGSGAAEPCVGDVTEFDNLRYGIQSTNSYIVGSNPQMPIRILNTQFNCLGGILHSGVNSATIHSNNFNVNGLTNGSTYRDIEAYGAYLDDCSGYKFENNRFVSDHDNGANSEEAVGLLVCQNRERNNHIYRNYFDNFLIGTEAVGWNKNDTINKISDGLKLLCNQYATPSGMPYDNYVDVLVVKDDELTLTDAQQGLPQQGSQSAPAGNLFGGYDSTGQWNFNNTSNNLIQYFHHDTFSSNLRVRPDYKYVVNNNNVTRTYNDTTSCLSKLTSGIGLPYLPDTISEARFNKSFKFTLLIQLTDSGDTEDLLDRINSADVFTMPALMNTFNGASPYLSETVCLALANANAPFTHSNIRDVLLQNPHAGRNPEILQVLANRPDHFPQNYINQIDSVGAFFSARDTLIDNVYRYGQRYSDLLHVALRLALDDSADLFEEYIEPLLDDADEVCYKYQLAQFYDERGDTVSALNTLMSIPSQFSLTTTQQAFHNDYLELRTILRTWNQTKNLMDLDSTELAYLIHFNNKSNGIESYVRPLLLLNNAIELLPPVYTVPEPETIAALPKEEDFELTDLTAFDKSIFEASQEPEFVKGLRVFPNPVEVVLTVEYKIKHRFEQAEIALISLNGIIVDVKPIVAENRNGRYLFDLSSVPEGVYLCRLMVNNELYALQKVTVKRP